MDSSPVTLGIWVAESGEDGSDGSVGLVIVGDPEQDRFALASRVPQGWTRIAWFTSQPAAIVAASAIERISRAGEYARIGDGPATSGLETSHPGVEWVTAASDDPSLSFPDRMSRYGMVRLWVAPSTDGQEFALINPGAEDETRILAYFDSEDAANEAIRTLDALTSSRRE